MTAPSTDAARAIWDAWSQPGKLAAVPANCRPRSLQEGYAAQAALDPLAGRRIGWKVAGTSAAAREMLGVAEPLSGPLYARFATPPDGEVELDTVIGVVECEFAVTIGRTMSGEPSYDATSVLEAVQSVHPAIELPGCRFVGNQAPTVPELVADAASAGTFVIGPAGPCTPVELPRYEVVLRAGERKLAEGRGANVMGGPLEVVAWLANHLIRRGCALAAGDLVLTGAAALSFEVAAGDRVSADFGSLGTVSLLLR